MTEKPRFSLTLTDELFDKLEKYRYERRYSTRSKAAAHLIDIALSAELSTDGLAPDEAELIDGFRIASDDRKEDMLELARKSIKKGRYEDSKGIA